MTVADMMFTSEEYEYKHNGPDKFDGFMDDVYASTQRSIEDLQFVNSLDKLYSQNILRKMRMIHRLKVSCESLRTRNGAAHRSVEAFIDKHDNSRSLEGPSILEQHDRNLKEYNDVMLKGGGDTTLRDLKVTRRFDDKPAPIAFVARVIGFIISVVTSVSRLFRKIIMAVLAFVKRIGRKIKGALSKKDIKTPEEFKAQYMSDNANIEYYDFSSNKFNNNVYYLFENLLRTSEYIEKYVRKSLIFGLGGVHENILRDEGTVLHKPLLDNRFDLNKFMKEFVGIEKKVGNPTDMIKRLDPKKLEFLMDAVTQSNKDAEQTVKNLEDAMAYIRRYERDKNLSTNNLANLQVLVKNVTAIMGEFSKATAFGMKLIKFGQNEMPKSSLKGNGKSVYDDMANDEEFIKNNFDHHY